MDFTKFTSMLMNNGLYLSRADLLGDPFEGAITAADAISRKAFYYEVYPPSGKPAPITLEEFERRMINGNVSTRQTMYVNCWHINEVESAAMWTQYAKSNEAIAVQSSYAKLFSGVGAKCYIGVVKYIDYDSALIPAGNGFWPFLHKRRSHSHEQELRLIRWEHISIDKVMYPNPSKGIWEPINLETVVERNVPITVEIGRQASIASGP